MHGRSARPFAVRFILGFLVVAVPACGRAQNGRAQGTYTADHSAHPGDAVHGVHEAMTTPAWGDPHLRLTPVRRASAVDSARASRVLAELGQGIAKYHDHTVALADGYRPFLPDVPQPVYHFTSSRRAIRSAFSFDASAPTSLLYEKTATGYRLVGAMYTAPKGASLDALDARVPLSFAQWHKHVDICVPKERQQWSESSGGRMRFGPRGSIVTEVECDAAGGRWIPELFGWMVHVHPYEKDPARIWGTHGATDGPAGHHHGH